MAPISFLLWTGTFDWIDAPKTRHLAAGDFRND
jgi:hypothetical protein